MSATSKIEMNNDMLDVVDSWLGQSGGDEKEVKQPVFEKRPQRLGLGAKYVPHKREETTNSLLKKKLNRENRRKREQKLENQDVSSESDSDEEMQSRAKAIKSKHIQKSQISGAKHNASLKKQKKQRS